MRSHFSNNDLVSVKQFRNVQVLVMTVFRASVYCVLSLPCIFWYTCVFYMSYCNSIYLISSYRHISIQRHIYAYDIDIAKSRH